MLSSGRTESPCIVKAMVTDTSTTISMSLPHILGFLTLTLRPFPLGSHTAFIAHSTNSALGKAVPFPSFSAAASVCLRPRHPPEITVRLISLGPKLRCHP